MKRRLIGCCGFFGLSLRIAVDRDHQNERQSEHAQYEHVHAEHKVFDRISLQ